MNILTAHWKTVRLFFSFLLRSFLFLYFSLFIISKKIRKPYLHVALQPHSKVKSRPVAKNFLAAFPNEMFSFRVKMSNQI